MGEEWLQWCGSCYSLQASQGQCRRPGDINCEDCRDHNFYENADGDNGNMYHNHNLHGDMMRNLDFGDGVARPGAAKSEKRDKGWKLIPRS